jgi:uncharacterized RDD family membrane protein YckC
LYPLATSAYSSSPLTAAATARALESYPVERPSETAAPVANPEPQVNITYQPSLFREGPGAPKVIPIPTLTPSRPAPPEVHSIRRVATRSTPRTRRGSDSQQALQFTDSESEAGLDAQNEMIFCEAPVALPGHRILATLVDLSWVLIGLGLFLGTLMLMGVDVMINRQTAPLLGALGVVIALLYRLVWYFANGDTPGMCFAGLRLVDFDGRRPARKQRGLRQVASLLSLAAAGLGLVWALVDEENLTWHDHISKTFPTPSA